jgi:tRNA (guanine-N7-)-methyltransferase
MGRNKIQKFSEIKELPNVVEFDDDDAREKLQKLIGAKELILEIGCGKGEYTNGLAELYPHKFFLGIDYQGERIWSGAKFAIENNIKNATFLRAKAENLLDYLNTDSVSEIWLTFPDPYPKDKQTRKRLTSKKFLAIYQKLLKSDGLLHLKTDSDELFHFTIKEAKDFGAVVSEKHKDIYREIINNALLYIPTGYEDRHLTDKKKIHYMVIEIP